MDNESIRRLASRHFLEGEQAALEGQPESANPYPPIIGSRNRHWGWQRGWEWGNSQRAAAAAAKGRQP